MLCKTQFFCGIIATHVNEFWQAMAYDLLDPNNGRSADSNHIKNDIYKYEASKGQEKEVSCLPFRK